MSFQSYDFLISIVSLFRLASPLCFVCLLSGVVGCVDVQMVSRAHTLFRTCHSSWASMIVE